MARTQVGIVGAGPAGLLLGRLLELAGIESVIVERRSREYVQNRMRAGMLEHRTVQLLAELGLDERLRREGAVHEGFELRHRGHRHRIPMAELTGGATAVMYGQQEIVRDAVALRVATGQPLHFDADEVRITGIESDRPGISYSVGAETSVLDCDVVVGCDGSHGVSRPTIPAAARTTWSRDYPFAWLGVVAEVAPSTVELIYACSERGFALHSMRGPQRSRFYLQVTPGEDLADWPDERIWSELQARLATDDGWTLAEGPISQKSVTAMRSVVTEPMRYGNLFLAGDAAHIVPPTAAKGLNLAASDVLLLADALVTWYATGDRARMDSYSDRALRGVWRAQQFSRAMTSLLHHDPGDGHDARIQAAELDHLCSSRAAQTQFCENYVGMPMVAPVHRARHSVV